VSAADAVLAGRAAAEAEMVDTFAATSTGWTTVDGMDVKGDIAQGSTPGKVQAGSRDGSDTATRMFSVGGVDRPILMGGLHIPISAPVPAAGDRGVGWEYTCTATGPATDPAQLGKRFLVVSVPIKTYATARRLDVVEVP
jgi:hypothetical protein